MKILEKYKPRKLGRINTHSVGWMVASMAVFFFTDFYAAVRYDDSIDRYSIGFCLFQFIKPRSLVIHLLNFIVEPDAMPGFNLPIQFDRHIMSAI